MILTQQQAVLLLRDFECRSGSDSLSLAHEEGDHVVVYDGWTQQEMWLLRAQLLMEPGMDARVVFHCRDVAAPYGTSPAEEDYETCVTVYPKTKPALKGDILRQLERY